MPRHSDSNDAISNPASWLPFRDRVKQARGKSLKQRDWIGLKKEKRRQQGKNVKADSKFTGRKRRDRF